MDFFIHSLDYFIQSPDKIIRLLDFLIYGSDNVVRNAEHAVIPDDKPTEVVSKEARTLSFRPVNRIIAQFGFGLLIKLLYSLGKGEEERLNKAAEKN